MGFGRIVPIASAIALVLLAAPAAAATQSPAATHAASRDRGEPSNASETFTVPIDNLEGLILFKAKLSGTGGRDTSGWLVMDTGAGFLALDIGLSRFLGIVDSTGEFESLALAERPLQRMEFGDLQIDQVAPIMVIDATVIRSVTDRPALGLLGESALRGFAMGIDYRAERMTFVPVHGTSRDDRDGSSSGTDGPGGSDILERLRESHALLSNRLTPSAISVPFEVAGDGKMLINAYVSDPRPPRRSRVLRMVLDTGATKTVLFANRIREKVTRHEEWPSLKGLTAPTLMGSAEAWLSRVPRIEVVGARRAARGSNVDVALIESGLSEALARDVGEPVDGLLGYSFLRRFRVWIDSPRRILWLDPVPHGYDDRPNEYSHVGVQIERHDGALRVTGVAEGSPAERAGIRRGDEIVSVDGRSVEARDVIAATRLLEGPPGSRVRIGIRREGGLHIHEMTRRRLL